MDKKTIVEKIVDYIEKHLEEEISFDTERDNYMSAEEALRYGLIDIIIDGR